MTIATTFRRASADVQVGMVTEACCDCGVLFAMTVEFDKERRRDHKTLYCPSGHGQSFGENDTERKLRVVRERLESEKGWSSRLSGRLAVAERSLSATRGVVTHQRNRASAGLCPCCNRHFVAMERHMATKHPDYTAEPMP